jgi:hypothetical protein
VFVTGYASGFLSIAELSAVEGVQEKVYGGTPPTTKGHRRVFEPMQTVVSGPSITVNGKELTLAGFDSGKRAMLPAGWADTGPLATIAIAGISTHTKNRILIALTSVSLHIYILRPAD